jgi:hypothetical protein
MLERWEDPPPSLLVSPDNVEGHINEGNDGANEELVQLKPIACVRVHISKNTKPIIIETTHKLTDWTRLEDDDRNS